MDLSELKQCYEKNGYAIHNDTVIPPDLIDNALSRIPYIFREEYDMGFAPDRRWNIGDTKKVQKIDQIHRCDYAFLNLVTHSELAEKVAAITGAKKLQVWGTQLIIKPSGGGDEGNIGWHTDDVNWYWWKGDVFTVWLPLIDMSNETGAITYIPESQTFDGDFKIDDAYDQNMQLESNQIIKKLDSSFLNNTESAWIPKGAFSLHHKKTVHGSGCNISSSDRICLAINLRTEQSSPLHEKDDLGYLKFLDNPVFSPVIYSR